MASTPTDKSEPRFVLTPATVIVACALILSILGLAVLFSASATILPEKPYYYVTKQLIGTFLAAGLCYGVSRVNFDFLRTYAWWLTGALVMALALVLVPHIGIWRGGARRWLSLGPIMVQVSEFAKLGLVFILAHYLALNQTRIGEWRRGFVYPLAMIGLFAGLVLKEPDYGTAALIVAIGLVLLFLAGAKWRFVIPAVVAVGLVFAVAVIQNPNRLKRFTQFLDVDANKMSGTYQLNQGFVAFAAGGTDGVGLGQGRQQLNFLPFAHTDFILPVIGEELGLWFTLGVVTLFTTIFIAGLVHLRRAPNLFQFLLAAGSILLICLQAIINIGVVTGVFPTKGMSLPFISAGLSNLLLMGLLIGVILNTQRTWGKAAMPGRAGSLREIYAPA